MTLASSGLQVHNGDLLRVEAWSNVAVTLRGNFLFRPILWPERRAVTLATPDMSVPSTRATTSATVLVTEDGFVEGCTVINVATAATQRGQTYGLVTLQRSGVTIAVLASDYIFSDYSLSLGQIVCPGPAGGHGAITRVTLASTAGGGTTGKVLGVVPTGALWRWVMGLSRYTASATVGSRNIRYRWRDGSGNGFGQTADATLTAGQTLDVEFAVNMTSEGSTPLLGNVGREEPSPDRALPAAYDLFENDTANIDAADTVTLEAQVEEWVVPNP